MKIKTSIFLEDKDITDRAIRLIIVDLLCLIRNADSKGNDQLILCVGRQNFKFKKILISCISSLNQLTSTGLIMASKKIDMLGSMISPGFQPLFMSREWTVGML